MRLGEHLGHQRNPDHGLGAGPQPCQEPEQSQLKRRLRESLARREHTKNHDAQRQRSHTAEIIRHHAEKQPADRPAQQSGHRQQSTDAANLRRIGVPTQQIRYRRAQDEREQPEIRRVQRPPQPGH